MDGLVGLELRREIGDLGESLSLVQHPLEGAPIGEESE